MPLHKDLTGAELHEPKGVATASAGQVYIADGAGSGVWTAKNADNLLFNKFQLSGTLNDISTPDERLYLSNGTKCTITRVTATLRKPITTAAANITLYLNGVATSVVLNFPAGSAAGTWKVSVTPISVPLLSFIEFRTDGASDGASPVDILVLCTAVV